jgi:hypothetical protein
MCVTLHPYYLFPLPIFILSYICIQNMFAVEPGTKTRKYFTKRMVNYLIKIIRTLLVPRRTFVWTLTLTNANTLKTITVKMACTPGKNSIKV